MIAIIAMYFIFNQKQKKDLHIIFLLCLQISYDESRLITMSDAEIKVWDLKTEKEIFSEDQDQIGEEAIDILSTRVNVSMAISFKNYIAYSSFSSSYFDLRDDNTKSTIKVLNIDSGDLFLLNSIEQKNSLSFSLDGKFLLASNVNWRKNKLDIFDLEKKKLRGFIPFSQGYLKFFEISPDNKMIGILFYSDLTKCNGICLYDINGNRLANLTYPGLSFFSWSRGYNETMSILSNDQDYSKIFQISPKWNDRIHYLFPKELKRLVFQLMLVKHRLERMFKEDTNTHLQDLSMQLWLTIFEILSFDIKKIDETISLRIK